MTNLAKARFRDFRTRISTAKSGTVNFGRKISVVIPSRLQEGSLGGMERRIFVKAIAGLAVAIFAAYDKSNARSQGRALTVTTQLSPPIEQAPTLLSAPIELAGDWGHMLPGSAEQVVERARHACLDGVRLLSDRQPTRLRIDARTAGPPAVWLHPDGSSMAWVMVDVGERAWAQLAYQFGHELGHVFANSWQPHAKPTLPCQWIEEALVEAFSLRGLGRLALSWKVSPPFPSDNAFGNSIAEYRQNIIQRYSALAENQGLTRDPAVWFVEHRSEIEGPGLNSFAQAAATVFLAEYERFPPAVEAVGALNRWPGRTGIPIDDYLAQWESSCVELGASIVLPTRLRDMLGIARRPKALAK